jgi:hypothetical protein
MHGSGRAYAQSQVTAAQNVELTHNGNGQLTERAETKGGDAIRGTAER